MISRETVQYLEMSDQAVEELLLLMSLRDCHGWALSDEIYRNIAHAHYYRHSAWNMTFTLSHHLTSRCYVVRQGSCYTLTAEGETRLRDLCELATGLSKSLPELTPEAFARIRYWRGNLRIYAFTNGRRVATGLRERPVKGYSIYVLLLGESALQLRYRALNRGSNPRLPRVYLGMTSKSPLERFDEHRFGEDRWSSRYARNNALCLMPLLYSQLNTQTRNRSQALALERRYAEFLREKGFTVLAGHHDRPVKNYRR